MSLVALLILMAMEFYFWGKWSYPYYRYGVLIFVRRFRSDKPQREDFVGEVIHHGDFYHLCRLNENTIAFRAKRFFIRTNLMHGCVISDGSSCMALIYLNISFVIAVMFFFFSFYSLGIGSIVLLVFIVFSLIIVEAYDCLRFLKKVMGES